MKDYGEDSGQSEKYDDEFVNMPNDFKALRIDTGRDDKERLKEMLKGHLDSVLYLKSELFNSSFTVKDASDACLKLY
jgi:hypothetical protein